jgi:hypothetical protein
MPQQSDSQSDRMAGHVPVGVSDLVGLGGVNERLIILERHVSTST